MKRRPRRRRASGSTCADRRTLPNTSHFAPNPRCKAPDLEPASRCIDPTPVLASCPSRPVVIRQVPPSIFLHTACTSRPCVGQCARNSLTWTTRPRPASCAGTRPAQEGQRPATYCSDSCRNLAYAEQYRERYYETCRTALAARSLSAGEGAKPDEIVQTRTPGSLHGRLLCRIAVDHLLENPDYQHAVNQLGVTFFMIGRMGNGSSNSPSSLRVQAAGRTANGSSGGRSRNAGCAAERSRQAQPAAERAAASGRRDPTAAVSRGLVCEHP